MGDPVARVRPALLAVLLVCGVLPSSAAAQPEARPEAAFDRAERVRLLQARTWEARAARVDGEIRIDGRIEEDAWALAEPVTDFYQREHNEGLPATELTEVRILYDDARLYLGIRCFDSEPERVRARAVFRDESSAADDTLLIMIDAHHDHRSAVQFVTNANGLVKEGLQTGETVQTVNDNFDLVWRVAGLRTAEGYEVEIAIPFKSLRFHRPADGGEVTFGLGFKRNIPRKNEEVYWPFVTNDSSWYRPAELGHLRGIVGIAPARNLQFRPYALGGRTRSSTEPAVGGRRSTGLDVKWGLTSGVTADFTFNTDFAQEEADVQQINFTRFSLFFPEKRQFFLEGEHIFQFGVPREAELVFTRRIGLSEAGQMIPLAGGARLSGRHGRTSLGAMSIQTRASEDQDSPAAHFSVLRVRRDLLDRSSAGLLLTSVTGDGRVNRVLGADASLLLSRIWTIEGFAARTSETNARPAHALYGRLGVDTDRFGASYRYLDVDAAFQPGLGFVRRRDVRQHEAEARLNHRPRSRHVRRLQARSSLGYITNHGRVLETRERQTSFTMEFETGDSVIAEASDRLEVLPTAFALPGGITVPAGRYRAATVGLRVETFRRRHARLTLGATTGGFWGGTRETMSLRGDYRVSNRIGFSGSYDVNRLALPQGVLTTSLFASRVQLAFNNNAALLSLVQFNHATRQLSTNVRFRWILQPGTDLFLVYNELDQTRPAFVQRNRAVVAKLAWLLTL